MIKNQSTNVIIEKSNKYLKPKIFRTRYFIYLCIAVIKSYAECTQLRNFLFLFDMYNNDYKEKITLIHCLNKNFNEIDIQGDYRYSAD